MDKKMTKGGVNAMLQCFDKIQSKLNESCGLSVAIELRMRLIGQLFTKVREKLITLVDEEHQTRLKKNSKAKKKGAKFWNCKLQFLDQAIEALFLNNLEKSEGDKVKKFRGLRNKLLHADFIGFMEILGIEPTGRIIQRNNPTGRNIVKKGDIVESVKSVESQRNQGLSKFIIQAHSILEILDNIIYQITD